ncbi:MULTISPECIES: Mu transposase C-terminal domain-containing protein [unclassified Arthrobacter]|uniref:Mu transposase C-terminal domain-containing protein n=1 Tax=unclassified Arthrobacter TaxID=235627 RepID=UPI002E05E534|nr:MULTISPECIES: DDE-type integrase/transposase/recombinase [unclassified Arthrobacter]MEC5193020.1 putative transposase [Arthrobacter sp. MP_M4]MEC5204550.1 putative transposase [Arthrobacter sp. MP_M7]
MEPESTPISGHGLLTMPDAVWELARRRAEVIAPLAGLSIIGKQAVDEASRELGISRRHVYLLIKRYREGSGVVTDVAPGHSSGGQGKGRLPERVEAVIDELVRKHYLTRQKLSRAAFYREVVQACRTRELPVPALNTVTRRIARLHPVEVRRRREGRDAVRPLQSAGGNVPAVVAPLDQVQIDHTVIDLIVVDDRDRQPIGRPYLTVAIDVYSRCLLGMVVTLEAPSSVSVGLCIAHMACEKRPLLETLGVDAAWPMSGKPRALFLDNAAEFKSEALRRGCEQHGIRLNYRPPGRPHYGGIVERIIGTAMQRVHELPGTTFSNPGQRGGYDADKMSALTLIELERWLTLAVAGYHGSIHESLNQTPAGRWHEGVREFGAQPVVAHPAAFLVDFLPVIRRRITRTGFVIDHVHYFANVLKPWIARRDREEKFIIRRDPRDISRVWVLEPEGTAYVEVPYRTVSHPAVTLWEHRQALARLRQQGHDQVNEEALFRMIDQMREITATAQRATRRSRRDLQRRRHLPVSGTAKTPAAPPDEMLPPTNDTAAARPFEEVEQW